MTTNATNSTRLTTRQLLVTTAAVAVALGMATADQIPIWFRLLGIAAGFYSLATCVFAFSATLASPRRELLFLIGLPMYLCCVLAASTGCFILIATIYFAIFRQHGG